MTIYILALHGVATGGPEATHQLSDALIEQGFDARLVYFRWEDFQAGMPQQFPAYEPFAEEYACYKLKLARSLPDEEGAVIVLPETACNLSFMFKRAKVLIWWLSVDNAFPALSGLRLSEKLSPNLNYLRRPNLYHASQSRYAERFVEALQLRSLGMLSDYTVDLTPYAAPLPMSERPKLVAVNANVAKVALGVVDLDALGEAIKRLDPEIDLIAIGGMSRAEIAGVFAKARVYVDLGNFPGKDRMPREAASMGCSVIRMPDGAGGECPGTPYGGFTVARVVCMEANDFNQSGHEATRAFDVGAERSTFLLEVIEIFSYLEAANEEETRAQEASA